VTPEEARWLALAENIQRADLTPIEEAEAYRGALDTGITQTELGHRLGKSQSYIAQKLRLLTLPGAIQLLVNRGGLTEGHARQLLTLHSFYAGTMIEINPALCEHRPDLDLPEAKVWDKLAWQLLRDIRPEDNPKVWFLEKKPNALIAQACRQFYRYLADGSTEKPQWEITAFWWACFTVYVEASVALLAKELDGWRERILTALWQVNLLKPPYYSSKKPVSEQEMLYWDYCSDLRHAGLERLGDCAWAELPSSLREDAEKCLRLSLSGGPGRLNPSHLQPWGFGYKRWCELTGREVPEVEKIEQTETELGQLESQLEDASTVGEFASIAQKGQAIQNEMAEVTLRCERKAGELCGQLQRAVVGGS